MIAFSDTACQIILESSIIWQDIQYIHFKGDFMDSIKALRSRTGLSQRRFAERYKIPVRTLQQWEQGLQIPPKYTVDMLARLVNVDSADCRTCAVPDADFPYLKHTDKVQTSWKVCISEAFENCEHIYPIQQHKVKELLTAIKGNPAVKSVYIFGSSTTGKCHIDSDLDIYMELTEDVNPSILCKKPCESYSVRRAFCI